MFESRRGTYHNKLSSCVIYSFSFYWLQWTFSLFISQFDELWFTIVSIQLITERILIYWLSLRKLDEKFTKAHLVKGTFYCIRQQAKCIKCKILKNISTQTTFLNLVEELWDSRKYQHAVNELVSTKSLLDNYRIQ